MTKQAQEIRDAAKTYAESCDNESGSFLSHHLEAIREEAFLAGRALTLKQTEVLVEAIESYCYLSSSGSPLEERKKELCREALKAWKETVGE